jgi:hypothetical protein
MAEPVTVGLLSSMLPGFVPMRRIQIAFGAPVAGTDLPLSTPDKLRYSRNICDVVQQSQRIGSSIPEQP